MLFLWACKYPSGTPLPAKQGTVLFSEDFSDNTKGWNTVNNDSVHISVLNNEYQFNLTGTKGTSGWYSWKPVGVSDTDTSFIIQADFEYKQGDSLSGFGLTYGLSDVSNNNFFGIEADGGYTIGKKVAGVYTPIVNWRADSLGLKTVNTLSINKRRDKKYYYSINGVVVQVLSTAPQFYGENGGFYCADNVSMAADNFKVTVNTPE